MTTFAASVTIVDLPVGTTVTGVELLEAVPDVVAAMMMSTANSRLISVPRDAYVAAGLRMLAGATRSRCQRQGHVVARYVSFQR